MKDLFKFASIKKMLFIAFFDALRIISDYGVSLALAIFITAPLSSTKLYQLLITIIILNIIQLLAEAYAMHICFPYIIKIEFDAKQYFYNKLLKIKPSKIQNYHSGYIQSLIKKVSELYSDILRIIILGVIPLTIGIIIYAVMAFKESILMGCITLIIFTITFIVRSKMEYQRKKHRKVRNEVIATYHAALIDFISNYYTVIKLNITEFSNKILRKHSKVIIQKVQKVEDARAVNTFATNSLLNLTTLIIIIYSIFSIKNGNDPLAFLLFYISIIGKITTRLNNLSHDVELFFEFSASKKSLDEILNDQDENKPTNNWQTLSVLNGKFSYTANGEPIYIPEFNLNKEDKISIMGESGQGKSTILNILSRIYNLNEGNILMDNKDIKKRKPDIVFISQDVELFNMSIRDNLKLGRTIKDSRIIEMFKDAGLYEWYQSLEHGLDETIGEKGIKLSSGQRQRLNLIRGILIDKDVYFLDEPTSNLDVESERKIISMIDKYLKNKTYVIVTHRPELKKLCNKHYTVENHTIKNS